MTTTTTRVPPTTRVPTTTTTRPIPEPGNTHHDHGAASWYGAPDGHCAHRTIAMGTAVRVTNPATGASTRCRIESRGPSDERRVIDLAKGTFAHIAEPSRGIVEVRLDW